ncbi:amino acid ABC transporter [Aureimonas ureilytica]|uniref:Amino acid ABC transporter n=1 Tax=Aureimonas ureilytica TaxID=401562 RepID=A0A175R7T6_9HYPH|nr:amino acid ABC transporter permease [Aureimonas ureilytica]KTQ92335.1 amino acid ABC transporter [Aureimonas ureilytica]
MTGWLTPAELTLFAQAFATTLAISAAGILLAVFLAMPLAVALRSRSAFLRCPARLYTEFMRGAPLVILLFLLYYGGPSVGLLLPATTIGVVGLGFYGAAYFAEIFRAGLGSVPWGEVEAARLLGLSRSQCFLSIEAPQAARLCIAPATGQVIALVKESAVLSIITISELTKVAGEISNMSFAVVTPYLTAALLYWALVELVARLGLRAERALRTTESRTHA